MYKLCVYIPEADLERVKSAIFEAGGGVIGNYDCCSWQQLGEGQFRPLQGSNPSLGDCGALETVAEYKLELVIDDSAMKAVLAAMITAHPYEEPAYQYWRVNEALSISD